MAAKKRDSVQSLLIMTWLEFSAFAINSKRLRDSTTAFIEEMKPFI